MQREKFDSEAIHSIGYNKDEEILEIEFNNGGLYQYFEAAKVEAENLFAAESKGTHFQNKILKRYLFIRIDLIKSSKATALLPLKPPRLPHL